MALTPFRATGLNDRTQSVGDHSSTLTDGAYSLENKRKFSSPGINPEGGSTADTTLAGHGHSHSMKGVVCASSTDAVTVHTRDCPAKCY